MITYCIIALVVILIVMAVLITTGGDPKELWTPDYEDDDSGPYGDPPF